MPCYHQLPAVQISPGSQLYFGDKFSPFFSEWKENIKNAVRNYVPGTYPKPLLVPCGQCIGCRLDYSHTWATRALIENKTSIPDSSYFLTLTYDDEHLPKSFGSDVDVDTGEVSSFFVTSTLRYRDCQLFLKSLRKLAYAKYGLENLRVMYCGEYGSKTSRPHYHFIIFNFAVPRSDLSICKSTSQGGFPLFESDIVNTCWKRGLAVLGLLSYNSACYTAGYMIDKKKGKDSVLYDKLGVAPPRLITSRRPGLAREFYDKNCDWIYTHDSLGISVGGKGIPVRPPKYYDNLYKSEHGDLSLEDVKGKRLEAVNVSNSILESMVNQPIDEYWYKKYDITIDNVTRGRSRLL